MDYSVAPIICGKSQCTAEYEQFMRCHVLCALMYELLAQPVFVRHALPDHVKWKDLVLPTYVTTCRMIAHSP